MVPTLTDTQRRFLIAVMQRLPLERVQEVYLFSPLKQGGVETGVAVIAAGDDVPAPGPGDGAVRAAEESDPTEAAARDDVGAPDDVSAPDDGGAPGADERRGADEEGARSVEAGETVAEMDADACVVVGETVTAALEAGDEEGAVEALAAEPSEEALDGDAPSSEGDDADAAGDADASDDAIDDATDEATDDAAEDVAEGLVDDAAAAPPPPSRSTIFTARYRLQLKGPGRGKWEVDVVEEADAPLVTVDVVVRGVQRRAGELSAVERLSPADLAVALDDRPWARP
jgi:hypothetical protein